MIEDRARKFDAVLLNSDRLSQRPVKVSCSTPPRKTGAVPFGARRGSVLALVAALMIACSSWIRGADLSLQTLYGLGSNPKNPQAGLVQANNGDFYGTTVFGGTEGENGTVFRITPNGVFTLLFSFNGTNGSRPTGGLIQGTDGNLYGTTAAGGTNGDNGTVFRITLNGAFTSLFSFNGANGRGPMASLVQGSDGNFYGTTVSGVTSSSNGTVFRIAANADFSSLYSFPSNGRSGEGPLSSLVQGSDGNFYGTTSAGGTAGDNGTVFRITPNGAAALLVSFNGANGSFPAAALVIGSDGNFYGTTQFGGTTDNGTVFRVTSGGALASLFSFSGPDGNYPVSPLVRGRDGNFYGTTSGDRSFGGTNTFGTVFRISSVGALTTLVSFDSANGACPVAGLALGSDGNFYSTTFQGGPGAGGTVFRLVEPVRISSITASGGVAMLCWTSFSGGTYRVEYKPALTASSWIALVPDVTAISDRTCRSDSVGTAAPRFYRVRLLP